MGVFVNGWFKQSRAKALKFRKKRYNQTINKSKSKPNARIINAKNIKTFYTCYFYPNPLPRATSLTPAQRQAIQTLDLTLKEELKLAKTANDYINAGTYVITACAISGYYNSGMTDKDFDELVKTWASGKKLSNELNEKWVLFMANSGIILWASYHGGIIDDNQEILDDFKNCLATRYTAQKLDIPNAQAELLAKGIGDAIGQLDDRYNKSDATQKVNFERLTKMIYALRNDNLEIERMIIQKQRENAKKK